MSSIWSSIINFISGSFICGICLEQISKVDLISFPNCHDQLHFYCKFCFRQYLINKINHGVVNISCPQFLCSTIVSFHDIKHVVPNEICQQYMRLRKMKDNPNYRECYACNRELHFINPTRYNMIQTCICGNTNCFVHGGAHRGKTCIEYECRSEQDSAALIRRTCKKCPKCGVPIEKRDGCDHMFCTQCNTNWSWMFGNIYNPR